VHAPTPANAPDEGLPETLECRLGFLAARWLENILCAQEFTHRALERLALDTHTSLGFCPATHAQLCAKLISSSHGAPLRQTSGS
jgi:hypothetical protein